MLMVIIGGGCWLQPSSGGELNKRKGRDFLANHGGARQPAGWPIPATVTLKTALQPLPLSILAEIAEAHAAGPDMDGLAAAGQSNCETAQPNNARADRPESALTAAHDRQPENGKRQAVGGQTGRSGVQEWRQ